MRTSTRYLAATITIALAATISSARGMAQQPLPKIGASTLVVV